MSRKTRKPQRERREETQAAVLEATVECLARYGYSGTSTVRIARRAKVSRGALLHYYASKAELLASAIEYLFRKRVEEFREAFARVPVDTARGAAAVDILWEMFRGETFQAWLELLVASRNDAELHREVSRITAQFMETVRTIYGELFPGDPERNPFWALAPDFVFVFLQGLALDQIVLGDDQRLERLRAALKGLEDLALDADARISNVKTSSAKPPSLEEDIP